MSLLRRSESPWALLGLAACAVIVVAGARLAGSGATAWWFAPRIPYGRPVFYLGLVGLVAAWLGLGRHATSVGALRWIAAAWCLPLVLGPVLASHDVYSYLAQGEILHRGLNPYHVAPAALGPSHFLDAVSPFWRHTTAPYGPLFLGPVALIVAVTGPHLIAGVLLVRGLDLVGVVLVAVFVPRLAAAVGGDPARATWLTLLSPLVLLELVAAGHNDALMVGLLVAGVTLAVEGRPLAGIALCALAATVKLPAAAAIVLIAAASARGRAGKPRTLGQAGLAAVVPGLAVGLLAGVGLSWLSTSLISTPQKVRLAITPSTGAGYTVARLVHGNAHQLESAFAVAALVVLVLVGLGLAYRTRRRTVVRDLGILLLVAALCGPAAWPWYLTWSLVLLAPDPRHLRPLVALTVVSVFLVKPNGILALPLHTAPVVIGVYLLIAAVYLLARATTWPLRPPLAQSR